jgi:hypothetical protein
VSGLFVVVVSIILVACFLVCVVALWYDNHPAVRLKRELQELAWNGEEAKRDVRKATDAAKAAMDRIARQHRRQ